VLLEDYEIYLPYALDAIARRWPIHGFADQSVRLFIGAALASPGVFSQLTITEIMRKLRREADLREFLATHFHAPFSIT
jgi:hypothetical protein